MRFEEAFQGWTTGRLTQAEAAMLLGQCERSFRRHFERYKADGLEGLLDKRLSQISKRRASVAEVARVVQTYKSVGAEAALTHLRQGCRPQADPGRRSETRIASGAIGCWPGHPKIGPMGQVGVGANTP